jgi:Caspase domain
MAQRALAIAAQTGDLTGVEGDAQRIAAALQDRGFEPIVLTGSAATRDGILAAYERLIADTRDDDDAAVVYYAGHGGYTVNLDGAAGSRTFQNIVPVDYELSTGDDYRGITALELSILQHRLTAKSKNVTVILDCCHAAQMSRDGAVRDAVARGLPHPLQLGFALHLAALEARYPGALAALGPGGNPDAVRLVACALTESAYEYTNRDGVRTGAFTEALLALLAETARVPMTWALLGQALRHRVQQQFPSQRPEIEGPADRALFSLTALASNDTVAIARRGDGYEIPAGTIHGVNNGDTYDVAAVSSPSDVVARAVVTATRPTTADLAITSWAPGAVVMPADPVAVPSTRAAIQRAVVLDAEAHLVPEVAAALARAKTLRIAAPDERDTSLATLRIADSQLTIEDAKGPLFAPASYPAFLEAAVQNLANLGVAQGVRALAGEFGVYASELDIEWGVVEHGALRALPDSNAGLGLGDTVYCRVRNRGRRALYVHLFNLGLSGRVGHLTSYAPAGFRLEVNGVLNTAEMPDRTLAGMKLSWPDGLPKATFPRVDTIVVIVTTEPANLTRLETRAAAMRGRDRAAAANPPSRLAQVVAQLQDGHRRDMRAVLPREGYLAKLLTFELHPREGKLTSPEFLVDNNPRGQAAGRSASAWTAPSASGEPTHAIAVRLAELVIEDNHALFAADVRVDSLICTHGIAGASGYRVETIPFKRVSDGERLPLTNALLYLGPVRDFVDICLWVSRDTSGSQALGDLLASRTTTPEVKDAAATLLATAGVATPWIAAVGASAVLARVAYELIAKASGTSIGLYRTSFLASEGFGAGRYPRQGLYRAQDLSFALQIDVVPVPA